MNKFWKWMSINKKDSYQTGGCVECGGLIDLERNVPKQMLIGYKIEYLVESGRDAFLDLRIITLNCINNLNRQLDKMIEEVDDDK